jgi:DNA-binding NarL/FixJ family response regulator
MYRTVVLAEKSLQAEVIAEVLRPARDPHVTAAVGTRKDLSSRAVQAAIRDARVLVYVAVASITSLPWRDVAINETRFLALLDFDGNVGPETALEVGARGDIGPDDDRGVLIERVVRTAEGRLAVPRQTRTGSQTTLQILNREDELLKRLRDLDIEILQLTAQGLTLKQAARRLHLTDGQVEGHTRHVCAVLGVANLRAAVARLTRDGRLTWDSPDESEEEDDELLVVDGDEA